MEEIAVLCEFPYLLIIVQLHVKISKNECEHTEPSVLLSGLQIVSDIRCFFSKQL